MLQVLLWCQMPILPAERITQTIFLSVLWEKHFFIQVVVVSDYLITKGTGILQTILQVSSSRVLLLKCFFWKLSSPWMFKAGLKITSRSCRHCSDKHNVTPHPCTNSGGETNLLAIMISNICRDCFHNTVLSIAWQTGLITE